ncbi:hypothetical protein [Cupriavidus necator]
MSATVSHKFSLHLRLRNQTQYNYVNTDVRQTSASAVGTVGARGFSALSATSLPLESLFVRLQSRDRHIIDYSIFNQTELSAKFDTGPVGHTLMAGVEVGHDGYNSQNYYRNSSCNGVALNGVGATTGYIACEPLVKPGYTDSPAGVVSAGGNRQGGSANTLAAYLNDTVEFGKQWKANATNNRANCRIKLGLRISREYLAPWSRSCADVNVDLVLETLAPADRQVQR